MQQFGGMFVNDPGPLVFPLPLFEGRKASKDPGLPTFLRLQLHQRALVDRPGQIHILGLELGPLGKPQKRPGRWIGVGIAPHDLLRLVPVAAPPLEPRKRHPRIVVGHPLHPALEHRPALGRVPHHLLHVDVLIPQKIHPGQQQHRPIQHVPRPIDELVPHLHLRVPQPQLPVPPAIHLQRPLEHAPRPLILPIILLEPRVLHPVPDVLAPIADVVLEVLAAVAEVGLVFLGVVDFHDRVEDVAFLPLGRFADDLLGGDLDGRRGAVFDAGLVGAVGGHGGGCSWLWLWLWLWLLMLCLLVVLLFLLYSLSLSSLSLLLI
mmetsp:Transcript_31417/g.66460  ORF Transcript_31417/g.66460 Transcript_31417/m.66460 type:complete len:320 (+) Transcript_31417:1725-2684(+)